MTEMSIKTNEQVIVNPKSDLLCNILAVASGVHYEVRTRLWKVSNGLLNKPGKLEIEGAANEKPTQDDMERYGKILSKHSRALYKVAYVVTEVINRGLEPKSHAGIRYTTEFDWFDEKTKKQFNDATAELSGVAERLLHEYFAYYVSLAEHMQGNFVQYRDDLLRIYPLYLDEEGRKRNHIPDPKPHTIAPLIMIDQLLGPLNNRGQFAAVIIKKGGPANGMTKGYLCKELKKCGWISSGTNASTATLPVHEVDPRTGGNYRSEPHEPHGKVVPSATAA